MLKSEKIGTCKVPFLLSGGGSWVHLGLTNNIAAMILKLILLSVYLVLVLWVSFKWRRCRFAIAGNEINFMVFPLLPLLALPGSPEAVAFRVLTCCLFLGSYVLWSRLLFKGIKEILHFFGVMWLMTVLFEIFFIILCRGDAGCGRWYLLLWHFSVVAAFAPFAFKRKESRFYRNTHSLNKFGKAILRAFPFFCISLGVGVVLLLCNGNEGVSYVTIAVVGAVPLLYMVRNMPACISYKEFEEMKKKAYILGRGIKDGQLMGEEHGLVNETLVEDVRIIYNLMTLFEREKLYRNVDVKIHDVARMIGTNKSYLSRALNVRVSKNFCQFVNYYRVKEICTLFIENPKSDMRSMCERCGFSSQSNFSIVFKFNTGHTPGDWCRMIKSKLEKNEPVQVDDYLL